MDLKTTNSFEFNSTSDCCFFSAEVSFYIKTDGENQTPGFITAKQEEEGSSTN